MESKSRITMTADGTIQKIELKIHKTSSRAAKEDADEKETNKEN